MLSREKEPVSPELVLVCPELRSLCFEAEFRPELQAQPDREPSEGPRPRLRLVAGVGALVLALAGGDVSGGHPAGRLPAAAPAPAPARVVPRRDATAAGVLVSARAARRLAALVPPRVRRHAAHRAPVAHRHALAATPSELEPASSMLGPLPDPTPRHRRLAPTTARELLSAAHLRHVDWAMLAAVLRSSGSGWPHPTARTIRTAAGRLSRRHEPAEDDLLVLAQYDRSVGIDALIGGLQGAKPVLGAQVLRDPRISMSIGGRSDVAAGRVDVRVLSLLLFLARRTGEVNVSSLVSGHPPPVGGGRSAHALGAAVEVSALGGRPVAEQQEPGGLVDRSIRAMLLLPSEVRPRQITSLIDLGGPAVALAGYREHIQISFDPTAQPVDRLQVLWRLAGSRYDVPWRVLAAINEIESHNGQNLGPSSAGAVGWMQFLPSTWRQYGLDASGDGRADPANPADAIFSAARYLAAAGAGTDLRRAIYAYNHADWYVNDVLRLAGSIAR